MSKSNLYWKNQKFIYKFDRHSANISEKLLSLYEKGEFFDTIIIAGSNSTKIRAHSIVLTALSEYFSEKFRANKSNAKTNVIAVKEIEARTLKLIIDFLYSGCIELKLQTVESIFRAAAILKLQNLFNACYDFIDKHTTPSDCLNWLRLADEFNLPTLKKNSLAFAYAHFQEVTKQKDLLLLSEVELKNFLFNQNPHEDFEELVLLSLMAWIKYDSVKREHLTFELLSMVRYQFLPPEAIIENRILIRKTFGYQFLFKWLQLSLSPKTLSLVEQQSRSLKPYGCEVANLAMVYNPHVNTTVIAAYNRRQDSWSSKRHLRLSWKKQKTFKMIVIGTKLFVVGGCIDDETTNSVDCLDLCDFKWTDMPAMSKSRGNCHLANLNGNLCVFGGICNGDFVDSVEIFNLSTCKWYDLELLYTPSKDCRILAHNGILYLVDFENGLLQCYDFILNEWSCKVLDKKQLKGFSLAGIGNFIYIIGGKKDIEHVNTVMRYNISKNELSEVASLPKARSSVNAHVIRNKIVICGGFGCWKSIEEYNPDTDTWTNLNCVAMDQYYDSVLCCLPPWIK